jgi:hypothetical protein
LDEGIIWMKALVLTLAALAGLGLAGPTRAQTAAPAAPGHYLCTGGTTPGQLTAVKATVQVDETGAVGGTWATWSLGGDDIMHAPAVQFDYPVTNGEPSRWPDGLNVLAVANLNPPPAAKTARIVLSVNGVEKASRPWGLYAQARAKMGTAPTNTVAFFGAIPFYPNKDNPADAGLAQVLQMAGEPDAKLSVSVIGDDGTVMSKAAYRIDQPAVRSKAKLQAVLNEALAAAKTPSQCRKQAN